MKIKSIGELTDFYYGELSGALDRLDTRRRQIITKYIAVNAVLALIAVPLIVWAAGFLGKHTDGAVGIIAAVVIGWAWATKFFYDWMTEKYAAAFKADIIRPLIHHMAPGRLHYYPANSVSRYQFQRSRLFTGRIDRYGGSDLVKGEIDGVHFQFSGVIAEQKVERNRGMEVFRQEDLSEAMIRQMTRSDWVLLFRGFFMVAEFPKHFDGITHVVPDHFDNVDQFFFSRWLKETREESWMNKDQRVMMDSPAFEKQFNVYSSDSIEAHYLLTHSMMERILSLQHLIGHRPLFISFSGGHIYLAIAYGEDDLFVPSVFESPKSYKIALDYISTIRNSLAIIEELRLNERIWSKAEGERSDVERYLHDFDATLSPKRPPGA